MPIPRPTSCDRRNTGGRMCLSLSGPLFEAIDKVARQEQMNRSALVREAVRVWIDRYNVFAPEVGRVPLDGGEIITGKPPSVGQRGLLPGENTCSITQKKRKTQGKSRIR